MYTIFPLVAVHGIYNDQERSRTRGWLLNSTSLGCLKLLCLPQPAMSDGCSQECRTLRVIIQYAFSAKCTVPWLRNTGQSAEVLKCQVGFSTALFWCSFPLALCSRNAGIPPNIRTVRRGSPPHPVHLTPSLRNLMWMFLIRGHFTALKPKGV